MQVWSKLREGREQVGSQLGVAWEQIRNIQEEGSTNWLPQEIESILLYIV